MYYVKFTQMAWRVFNPEGEAIAAFHSDSRWDGSILARAFCEWINSPDNTVK